MNCEDEGVAFWKPVESPGTRPLRSWAFDIGCALFAAAASLTNGVEPVLSFYVPLRNSTLYLNKNKLSLY